MKPIDKIQHLRAHLRTLALASAIGAAALFTTATPARAELVGHWLSGAPNLSDTSEFTFPAGFTIRGLWDSDGWGSEINVNDTPAKWHHFAGVVSAANQTTHEN